MKLSKILFEALDGKKILLLVHPDIIFEVASRKIDGKSNVDAALEYIEKYKQYKAEFDYIIVHLFYSNRMLERNILSWDKKVYDLYLSFVEDLKDGADVVLHDENYSASFQDELPSYAIDNPNSTIYLSGGYKDLCVEKTKFMLHGADGKGGKLGSLLTELNIKVVCFSPLLIDRN